MEKEITLSLGMTGVASGGDNGLRKSSGRSEKGGPNSFAT